MSEIWKDIRGYEGFYQVSNMGHFRSLDCERMMKNGISRFYHGKVIATAVAPDDYLTVDLTDANGVRKTIKAHRLVAEAFVPNPHNKPIVNHRNEYKHDNRATNLEWVTNRENITYGKTQKRRVDKIGWKIVAYDTNGRMVGQYGAMREAERALGIPMAGIYRCCKGEIKEYKGYKFRKIYGKSKQKGG